MAADNLSICFLQGRSHTSSFPTSHYHGITVTIDISVITDEMKRILELLSIDINRILKFTGRQDFYMIRANETVKHIIVKNITEHYTIEELPERFGISPTAMKRCFKGMYGAPVYAHIRTYRLQIAEKLLREGRMSVAEIAVAIGYTNPNKFTSAFRTEYGMSPTEYKKECPNG